MDRTTLEWLDRISKALADARAVLACFGVDQPALATRIETALRQADDLKKRTQPPSSD
jgi:hypothetical protein